MPRNRANRANCAQTWICARFARFSGALSMISAAQMVLCDSIPTSMSTSLATGDDIRKQLNLICAQLNVIQARLELKPTLSSSPWLPLSEAARALHIYVKRPCFAGRHRSRSHRSSVRERHHRRHRQAQDALRRCGGLRLTSAQQVTPSRRCRTSAGTGTCAPSASVRGSSPPGKG